MDHLGFVEAVDCFGESIVVAVADAANRGLDAGLRQALGVFDGDVLAASIAMMDEPATLNRASIVQCLFQGIENEGCMRRPAHPPADDPAGIGVYDESHVDEAGPGRDVGEIGDPEHVRRRSMELTTDLIERAWRCLVA